MLGDIIGPLAFAFLLTTALCVVGGLFLLIASFAVFRDSEGRGDQKRPVKAVNLFTASVYVSVVNELYLLFTLDPGYIWESVTTIGFLILLAGMIFVHFESGQGKRLVLIGTTAQCIVYILGLIDFLFDK